MTENYVSCYKEFARSVMYLHRYQFELNQVDFKKEHYIFTDENQIQIQTNRTFEVRIMESA